MCITGVQKIENIRRMYSRFLCETITLQIPSAKMVWRTDASA